MSESAGNPVLVLALYCVLVLLASLAGGWLLIATRLTHTRLQLLVSFVAGLMLGMALLHLIPHANFQMNSLDRTMLWVLVGFLVMFFLQRFFHFHHHDLPDEDPEDCCRPPAVQVHEDDVHHIHTLAEKSAHQLSWSGTAVGMGLHSLLDGVALAAAVAAEAHGRFGLVGFGTALAIVLHKPFDAMAISALMAKSGCSRARRQVINGAFALVAPAGVVLFYFGAGLFSAQSRLFLGCALAFCGGMFLCISCSDLLPELQFHSHDRLRLSGALGAGLAVAALIGQFETSGHEHHEHGQAAVEQKLSAFPSAHNLEARTSKPKADSYPQWPKPQTCWARTGSVPFHPSVLWARFASSTQDPAHSGFSSQSSFHSS